MIHNISLHFTKLHGQFDPAQYTEISYFTEYINEDLAKYNNGIFKYKNEYYYYIQIYWLNQIYTHILVLTPSIEYVATYTNVLPMYTIQFNTDYDFVHTRLEITDFISPRNKRIFHHKNGQLHNLNGPAYFCLNSLGEFSNSYYVYGERIHQVHNMHLNIQNYLYTHKEEYPLIYAKILKEASIDIFD